MCFTTIVTFILPLIAFTTPTPASRRADTPLSNELEDAVHRYSNGMKETLSALKSIEIQFRESTNPLEHSTRNTVEDTLSDIFFVAVILGSDNTNLEYVDSLCAL